MRRPKRQVSTRPSLATAYGAARHTAPLRGAQAPRPPACKEDTRIKSAFLLVGDTMGLVDGRRRFGGLIRFSPSSDPICPSYPIIAWDAADSRGSLRNIVEPSYPVGYIGSLYLLDESGWPLSPPLLQTCLLQSSSLLPHCYRRRTVDLFRHDAVFVLFFPPTALMRWLVADTSFAAAFSFPDFAAAPQ